MWFSSSFPCHCICTCRLKCLCAEHKKELFVVLATTQTSTSNRNVFHWFGRNNSNDFASLCRYNFKFGKLKSLRHISFTQDGSCEQTHHDDVMTRNVFPDFQDGPAFSKVWAFRTPHTGINLPSCSLHDQYQQDPGKKDWGIQSTDKEKLSSALWCPHRGFVVRAVHRLFAATLLYFEQLLLSLSWRLEK